MPARMEWRATDPDTRITVRVWKKQDSMFWAWSSAFSDGSAPFHSQDITTSKQIAVAEARSHARLMGARNLPRLKKQKISEGEDGRETIE